MSELDVVYAALAIAFGAAAYCGRQWYKTWKLLERTAFARDYWEQDRNAVDFKREDLEEERDCYRHERAQMMKYAHVRAIVANIESGKARKK